MAAQMTFKRYELKYLLTLAQKDAVLRAMQPYMCLDKYGRSSIRNIYYDTDTFRLIRASVEKPVYKEKLRVRSYGEARADDTVFVELKKKYQSVVYKRRLTLPFAVATAALMPHAPFPVDTQIAREITYFRDFYQTLHPAVCLCYEREAFYATGGGDFRVTFDDNIRYRTEQLDLCSGTYGRSIIEDGLVLMELKAPGAIPLWMVRVLADEHIHRTSFSKYGRAYYDMLSRRDAAVSVFHESTIQIKQQGDISYA